MKEEVHDSIAFVRVLTKTNTLMAVSNDHIDGDDDKIGTT